MFSSGEVFVLILKDQYWYFPDNSPSKILKQDTEW